MMQTHPGIIPFRFKLRYFFFSFKKMFPRRIEFFGKGGKLLKTQKKTRLLVTIQSNNTQKKIITILASN